LSGERGASGPWDQPEIGTAVGAASRDPLFSILRVVGPGHQIWPALVDSYDLRERDPSVFAEIVERIRNSGRKDFLPAPKVFLCYAREDARRAREVHSCLAGDGVETWFDEESLLVGLNWENEIARAIESCDFFAMCLSKASSSKTGFVQKEIRLAIREFQRRPPGAAYLLPIRVEKFEIPSIKLDDVTTLSQIQWIDMFVGDRFSYTRLQEAIWRLWNLKNRPAWPQLWPSN
jgi:hypothetical protein